MPDFTEDYRQRLRLLGRKSLYFFGTSILGFNHYSSYYQRSILAPVHRDLCHFLEGRPPYAPWRIGLVVMFRGGGKSTWTDIIYPAQRTLYGRDGDLTWKLIENSSENAKVNHFLPLLHLFTESPRAQFLQWLYREELPEGFRGWNSQRLSFRQSHPEVGPSLSYWGMDTRWEGTHPRCLTLDDLEGAEAEKSDVSSEDAWRAFENARPLLADQAFGQILVVGTPHGENPFVWRLRDSGIPDAVFWKPLLDESESASSCLWPEKFPPEVVESLRKSSIWDQQYMLRKRTGKITFFDMAAVRAGFYARDAYDPTWVRYPSLTLDPDAVDAEGHVHPQPISVSVNLRALRYFVQVDPSHKVIGKKIQGHARVRVSDAEADVSSLGLAACGVASDMHVLVVDYLKKIGLDLHEQAQRVFEFYCRFMPYLVTVEAVGAQKWFRSHVEAMEGALHAWRYPRTTGPLFGDLAIDLPRMSSRLIYAEKPTDRSKQVVLAERLSPWFNGRLIHLHERQTALLYELDHIEDDTLDLLDAIAQGAGRIPAEQNDGQPPRADAGRMVWSAPLGQEYDDLVRGRLRATEVLKDPRTGWRPWFETSDAADLARRLR